MNFGDPERYWDFRSLGHGTIEFEEIIRALNYINYQGPLSVEWRTAAWTASTAQPKPPPCPGRGLQAFQFCV